MKRFVFVSVAVTAMTMARVTIAAAEVITLYCTNGRYLSGDTYLPLADPDTTLVIDTLAKTANNIPADVFNEVKITFPITSTSRSADGKASLRWEGTATIDRTTGRYMRGGPARTTIDGANVGTIYMAWMYDCGLIKPKPKF
jgi:hypothetical protein